MIWFSNGGLKTRQKSLFMVQNVWYWNGLPNHVIKQFEQAMKPLPEYASKMFSNKIYSYSVLIYINTSTLYVTV